MTERGEKSSGARRHIKELRRKQKRDEKRLKRRERKNENRPYNPDLDLPKKDTPDITSGDSAEGLVSGVLEEGQVVVLSDQSLSGLDSSSVDVYP